MVTQIELQIRFLVSGVLFSLLFFPFFLALSTHLRWTILLKYSQLYHVMRSSSDVVYPHRFCLTFFFAMLRPMVIYAIRFPMMLSLGTCRALKLKRVLTTYFQRFGKASASANSTAAYTVPQWPPALFFFFSQQMCTYDSWLFLVLKHNRKQRFSFPLFSRDEFRNALWRRGVRRDHVDLLDSTWPKKVKGFWVTAFCRFTPCLTIPPWNRMRS